MAHVGAGLTRVLSPRLGWSLAALLPLVFLGVFFAWPVVAIVALGVGEGGVLPVLARADTWDLVAFTLGQAAAATVLALVAGLPVAFLLARCRVRGTGLVRAAVMVPFVLPTVVVGLAFRALWVYPALVVRYLRLPRHDWVLLGYPAIPDVFVIRLFAIRRGWNAPLPRMT